MQVRVYECKDGEETLVNPCAELIDVLGDDEYISRAHAELKRSGRVWVGGGAQPLFLLFPYKGDRS
jgi:hypothetical protein